MTNKIGILQEKKKMKETATNERSFLLTNNSTDFYLLYAFFNVLIQSLFEAA